MKHRRPYFGPIPVMDKVRPTLDMRRVNLNPSTADILFDVLLWRGVMSEAGLGTLQGCADFQLANMKEPACQ